MKVNVYKQARLRAAESDPSLASASKAHEKLYISREKLLMIEQTDPAKRRDTPSPDEVDKMAQVYNAPELRNHYCTHECPLGDNMPRLEAESLDRISVQLMSALHYLENAEEKIYRILEDGKVYEQERQEFLAIVQTLNKIAHSANSLELWAQKNGLLPHS